MINKKKVSDAKKCFLDGSSCTYYLCKINIDTYLIISIKVVMLVQRIFSYLICSKSKWSNMSEVQTFNCTVCYKGLAKKQVNYGAITCHSCRTFFRRYSLEKGIPPCDFEKIRSRINDSIAETPCVNCRYQKCLRFIFPIPNK